ncbi:hypothetical protein TREMEDRAFT_61019 [Tremella mesenterica DSM 1558]|uniref:uncharacterized protein n=1 Tax=Tremella mesenterica (strain ATCC 24925 / CBS 8224 / DSM 1558 / NBRC 9311 / NRRL Y-6157 / RJB 2259-6 / UBC 559-6) TaxID=578456 RepID=UPI0003F49165|nr:uncharacterized protein TREMEDRAFT_61019 [Tremella mesenterica DSM 1558]EIW70517.1 hypothetical protein TREMEDRAFT_61019 [Tremella mesenterica DSM 1558]
MSQPLAPNRIHSLPVQVNYHLPSSTQTFTTVFEAPQPVYVHPNAASTSDDEVWGSIYLKTVIHETHPSYPGTPDLSVYILDARETYLRRSRASSPFPSHLRPSSPAESSVHIPQVWTGKGLISWALDEPGQGKNLITGRLIRSREFTRIIKTQGMNPMEALMIFEEWEEESWGIEISLGLKSGTSGSFGIHPQIREVMAMDNDLRRSSSSPSSEAEPIVVSHSSTRKSYDTSSTHERVREPSPEKERKSESPDATPRASALVKRQSSVKRKSEPRKRLASVDVNRSSSRSGVEGQSSDSESFPKDLPAEAYTKPEHLTKEQAQRLLESPAFLGLLEKLTGEPVGGKRKAEGHVGGSSKKVKPNPKSEGKKDENTLKCYNCGRTKSAVWRQKTMEDGKSVRVCNACGLYWNKLGQMRPPTLWQGVDEDVRAFSKKKETQTPPAPRMDAHSAPSTSHQLHNHHNRHSTSSTSSLNVSGFKRTLSVVAEKEAQRIASLRTKPRQTSNLHLSTKPTMTSPIRGPTPSRSLRNSRWNPDAHGASSPGGWAQSMDVQIPNNEGFNPVDYTESRGILETIEDESPNAAIRRILGTDMALQALQMPLSDDTKHSSSWETDLSHFFQIPTDANTSSDQLRPHESSDDDALSLLFHRTSSHDVFRSSSPPFDFSQLPPSSPPAMPSSLSHSALLDSSPEYSPAEPSPDISKTPRKNNPKMSLTPRSARKAARDAKQAQAYIQSHHQIQSGSSQTMETSDDPFDITSLFHAEDGGAMDALTQILSGLSNGVTGQGNEQDIWGTLQGFTT